MSVTTQLKVPIDGTEYTSEDGEAMGSGGDDVGRSDDMGAARLAVVTIYV